MLWQKVGTLLDIIFCNTQDYELSTSSRPGSPARRVQVETSFFYNTHGLTVDDVAYLREEERIHRQLPQPASPAGPKAVRHSFRNAETIAWDAIYQPDGVDTIDAGFETLRQGLQSLAVLFRMTDSYLARHGRWRSAAACRPRPATGVQYAAPGGPAQGHRGQSPFL